MKNRYKIVVLLLIAIGISSCATEDYSFGDLKTPTNIIVTADLTGKTTANPNGDGSGEVKFTITGDNLLTTKVDFNADDAVDFVNVPTGKITKKYTTNGVNTYVVTVVAYGTGGVSTVVTKEITVKTVFDVNSTIVTNLTNDSNKTWVVDRTVYAHFGVGPSTSAGPDWYNAQIDEKVAFACFYTSTFKFTKESTYVFKLDVTSPDGAFTKRGAKTSLPGLDTDGGDPNGDCAPYSGGSSAFSFMPASSGIAASASTQTSILLSGVNTFIGYGGTQKEYEILQISNTSMRLRVLGYGPESGNAWYLTLKPAP